MTKSYRLIAVCILSIIALTGCGTHFGKDNRNKMIVSVCDQRMVLVHDGKPVRIYKVSTSKFGTGDRPGSNRTPLGRLQVARKIGAKAPLGSVFKNRRWTGEILASNTPGRDPVVTRILWLTGTESRNCNAFSRAIYIHGTPEERKLGWPASYGCIRMSSKDVADLYDRVGWGADVFVIYGPIKHSRSHSSSGSSTSNLASSIRNKTRA